MTVLTFFFHWLIKYTQLPKNVDSRILDEFDSRILVFHNKTSAEEKDSLTVYVSSRDMKSENHYFFSSLLTIKENILY